MRSGVDSGEEMHAQNGRAVAVAAPASVGPVTRDAYASLGGETNGVRGESLAVTLRQYLYMVLKRKWLILSISFASATLGGLSAALTTPQYKATVRVQIEREAAKVVEGGTTSPTDAGGSDFLRTQFELLKSRAMAERVALKLRLADDNSFFQPRNSLSVLRSAFSSEKSVLPVEVRLDLAAGLIQSSLTVVPVTGSRLVDLSVKDPSPARAQQIANAYADAYIASNLDKRFEANAYAKTFLEDQVKQLKIRLEDSEKQLLEFAEKERIVEVTDKSSIAETNLATASGAVGQLIGERMKNEQMWRQVENAKAINLPQLLSNPVIEVLRGQRKALETEYQEKLENYKPSYPFMLQISSKIKEIDRQLASEVNTIRNSLKAAYDASLEQENGMKARIETLRSEVLDLQRKNIQNSVLKREVETNRGLYNNLLQRYKEVDVAGGVTTNNIFVVDRARSPRAPSEPNVPLSLLLSLAVGFAGGAGLALFLELLDDRIRTPEEVEQLSGLATLGVIPLIEGVDAVAGALRDPRSTLAEAYRSLATALQFSTEAGLPRSIVVTSAAPSEGKSTTVMAIAQCFAQIGLKVLIVDADLRKPSMHTKFGLSNAVGLSNYLIGSSLPPEIIQSTGERNLSFMASGPMPPNAADLLGGAKIPSLISVASEIFDLVIFDAPPLLTIADAQLLASAVEATVFVVGAGGRGKGIIVKTLRRLKLSRITVIGSVLTKFDPNSVGYTYGYGYGYDGYGYSGYSYGYGYGYSAESANPKTRLAGPGQA
ncbi:MAG: polysaccharide biosynthesis tyrosine autokinase [Rhodomicrobium sp.]